MAEPHHDFNVIDVAGEQLVRQQAFGTRQPILDRPLEPGDALLCRLGVVRGNAIGKIALEIRLVATGPARRLLEFDQAWARDAWPMERRATAAHTSHGAVLVIFVSCQF